MDNGTEKSAAVIEMFTHHINKHIVPSNGVWDMSERECMNETLSCSAEGIKCKKKLELFFTWAVIEFKLNMQ